MKTLVTVISGLLMGLSLLSSNFSPIAEVKNFLANKRRIFIAAGVAVTGYLLIFSGVIIGLVEWALQNDSQGFVMWSSLMSVAIGMVVVGALSIIAARLAMPLPPVEHESVFTELNRQFNITDHLEAMIKHFAEDRPAQPSGTPTAAAFQEEKFAEPATEPRFSDLERNSGTIHH